MLRANDGTRHHVAEMPDLGVGAEHGAVVMKPLHGFRLPKVLEQRSYCRLMKRRSIYRVDFLRSGTIVV